MAHNSMNTIRPFVKHLLLYQPYSCKYATVYPLQSTVSCKFNCMPMILICLSCTSS
jgi:hypothetical protein